MKTKNISLIEKPACLCQAKYATRRYNVNMEAHHLLCEKKTENHYEATNSYPEEDERSNTKASVSVTHALSGHRTQSTNQEEYKHGTVGTLGTPTTFWIVKKKEKTIEP